MLHHSCSFGAFINDYFDISNNASNIQSSDNKNGKMKFEIDPVYDNVWNNKLH
jgi:hypothetical protein